jgi:probable FeS assembly SUF system protein SufT
MSLTGKSIIIERDVTAILVPSGQVFELKAGTPVRVTQALGGNYSVEVFGQLVMISSEDQDALGLEPNHAARAYLTDNTLSIEEKTVLQIKTCFDPEIPVNIYDLGLIYDISIFEDTVNIAMTLTSPTCGMGPFIIEDVKRRVHQIQEVKDVHIDLVFDPPWDKSRMSQVAKLQLNLL